MLITITLLYAGLLALVYLFLGMRIPFLRGRYKVSLGDGEGKFPRLQEAVRMHGNAAETIPLGIILLFFVDATGYSIYIVHGIGIALLAGRILHPIGLMNGGRHFWARGLGMVLTWLAIGVAAILCLLTAASSIS